MTPALQRLLPGVALGFVIGLLGYALWARLSSEPESLAGANLPSVPEDPVGESGDPNQDLASQLADASFPYSATHVLQLFKQ